MSTSTPKRRALIVSVATALTALAIVGPSSIASAGDVSACAATDLSARVTGTGAGVSQPAVYITVTNTSSAPCAVRGYPVITRAATRTGPKAISVTNGAVMNAPQARVKRIVISPDGHAWFAVGAATAYDTRPVTFTRIRFATAAGGPTRGVRVSLQASRPTGQPYPMGVTAFMPGIGRTES
jgi:hypothetical protein